MHETILQFGTGKFLRCFLDLFVEELNQGARQAGKIVAVQSTGTERARQINRQHGRFHAAIRGLEAGQVVDRTCQVTSVSRALAAAEDWNQILQAARSSSLVAIASNTTEAGLALVSAETPTGGPPESFPAKLLAVLLARFEAGGDGLTILPCELVERNADRLLDLVLEQAARWPVVGDAVEWIRHECVWRNTLVYRIVSAPRADDPLAARDPLLAVAEPFALWLIEGDVSCVGDPGSAGNASSSSASGIPVAAHPAVEFVEQLEPYHLRKVRILNGAHTALVAKALPLGIETVREALDDARIRPWLESLLFEEIVPTIEDRAEGAEAFARRTLERLANPFLDHRLADIALHHDTKLTTRLRPTLEEYRARFGRSPRHLAEIL
jgi:tagaturonate reductase